MRLIFGILLILSGAALLILAYLTEKKKEKYASELEDFRKSAKEYDAVLLDVIEETLTLPSGKEKKRPAAVIQIRIEEQKRTLVHRCEEKFYGSYKRGEKVRVLFIEEMPADRAMLSEDNRYTHFLRSSGKKKLIFTALGTVIIVIGALLILII